MAVLPKRTVLIVSNSGLPRRDPRWFPGPGQKRPRIQKGAFETRTSEALEFYREQPRPATAGIEPRSGKTGNCLAPTRLRDRKYPAGLFDPAQRRAPPSVLICESEVFHVQPR